jgi:Ni,Fe-hydrogenase I cytochrome b subunit
MKGEHASSFLARQQGVRFWHWSAIGFLFFDLMSGSLTGKPFHMAMVKFNFSTRFHFPFNLSKMPGWIK